MYLYNVFVKWFCKLNFAIADGTEPYSTNKHCFAGEKNVTCLANNFGTVRHNKGCIKCNGLVPIAQATTK